MASEHPNGRVRHLFGPKHIILDAPDGRPVRSGARVATDAGTGPCLFRYPGKFLEVGLVRKAGIVVCSTSVWVYSIVGPVRENHITRPVVSEVPSLFGTTADEVPCAHVTVRPLASGFVLQWLLTGLIRPDEHGVAILSFAGHTDSRLSEHATGEGGARQLCAAASGGIVPAQLIAVLQAIVGRRRADTQNRVQIADGSFSERASATHDAGLTILCGALESPSFTCVVFALCRTGECISIFTSAETRDWLRLRAVRPFVSISTCGQHGQCSKRERAFQGHM